MTTTALFSSGYRLKTMCAAILIAAATFVVFSGALKNDFIGWDDEFYVFANPYITPLSPSIVWQMFGNFHFKSWTPLTLLSHAVDYRLWGLDPRGHHLTNIVLHCLNAVWVFLLSIVLFRIYRRPPSPGGGTGDNAAAAPGEMAVLVGAIVSALFFAWHPLRVEAVACASSRKDLLCAALAYPSLLVYIGFMRRRGAAGAWRWYAGSIGLYLLALLAKGSVMTLPVLLLILDLLAGGSQGGWRRWGRLVWEKVPFGALALAAAVVAFVASEGKAEMAQVLRAGTNVGRGAVGLYDTAFYLIKFLWPAELAELYTFPRGMGFTIIWLLTPAVTLACVLLWWCGRRSWLFAWAVYVVALLPMAGFITSTIQVLANRYAYFAATPFTILLGGGIAAAWASPRRSWRWILVPLAVMLAALTFRTLVHMGDWRDAETVWRHTLQVSPAHALAYNELGLALQEKGEYTAAVETYAQAIRVYPEYSEAMCNMGGAYISLRDTADAERILRRALELSPNDYATYTNIGNVRMLERRFEEAITLYRQSIAINPRAAVTAYDLGYALMLTGKPEEALASLSRSIHLNPNYRDAYYLIGEIMSKQPDGVAMAWDAYRRAARLGHTESQRILISRGMDW